LVPEKVASGAIVDDAEELAKYERLARVRTGLWISWRRLYPRKAVHSHFVWLD
jgi:hypothetical protein